MQRAPECVTALTNRQRRYEQDRRQIESNPAFDGRGRQGSRRLSDALMALHQEYLQDVRRIEAKYPGVPDGPAPGWPTRRDRAAAAFRYDPDAERLLELRESDPAAFASLGPRQALAAGMYSQAKQQADELGVDVSPPSPAPQTRLDGLAGAFQDDLRASGYDNVR